MGATNRKASKARLLLRPKTGALRPGTILELCHWPWDLLPNVVGTLAFSTILCNRPRIEDKIQIWIHGDVAKPTLIYLPGMHGDWTLVSSFRAAVKGRVRFVEVTYPRTPDWSLDQYSAAVTDALAAHQIREGWVLAESFSSQVAWGILNRARQTGFEIQGLILAGGFVRHPVIGAVYAARIVNRATPMWLLKMACSLYARYARFRHRHAQETLACISEFVKNRLSEIDRRAVCHRYDLIAESDLRSIAQEARLPVYQLCGFLDPIVPWLHVRNWLKANCPGY